MEIVVALLGVVAALIIATPGYLAWRTSQANGRKADAAAAIAAAERAAVAAKAEAAGVAAAAATAEATRVAELVRKALIDLGIKINGRTAQLIKTTETAAHATGRAEGVEAERSRQQASPEGSAVTLNLSNEK